jgi:hypothetical protein
MRRVLQEADSSGDRPQAAPGQGGARPVIDPDMTEDQIRNAGLAIDVPFEAVDPEWPTYEATGQQEWTPPPGFRLGMPPVDPILAERLGVPEDLSQPAEGGDGAS